jgi:two-component system response regulator DegU
MSPSQAIRVLLVDDHTILRQGMKQLLEMDERISICGEALNGEEAILQALTMKPDVILMDINMPKVNGYMASRSILMAWPEAKILVLTNQDEPDILKKFLELGVKGYFLKDVDIDVLIQGILDVVAGQTVELSQELQEKLKQVKQNAKSDTVHQLTEREKEVLKALTKGVSNQELAEMLTVSPKTVHNHLYNIYSKIGVSSRSEAIVWAIESGFMEAGKLLE